MNPIVLWLVSLVLVCWVLSPGASESFRERKRKAKAKAGSARGGVKKSKRDALKSAYEDQGIPGLLNATALKKMKMPVRVRGHFESIHKAQRVCSKARDCIGYIKTRWAEKNPKGGPQEYYSLIRTKNSAKVLAVVKDPAKRQAVMRNAPMTHRTTHLFLKKNA